MIEENDIEPRTESPHKPEEVEEIEEMLSSNGETVETDYSGPVIHHLEYSMPEGWELSVTKRKNGGLKHFLSDLVPNSDLLNTDRYIAEVRGPDGENYEAYKLEIGEAGDFPEMTKRNDLEDVLGSPGMEPSNEEYLEKYD